MVSWLRADLIEQKQPGKRLNKTDSNGEYFIYMWWVAWYDLERNEFSNVCTLNIVYITAA